jgi:hypothetical protein
MYVVCNIELVKQDLFDLFSIENIYISEDFYQDNISLFPSKSLYLDRYPQENLYAQKEKDQLAVLNPMMKELGDLQNDIQVGIDLEKV